MKVEIPSKFKYKSKEQSISLAIAGPDKKKVKLTYIDENLFVELPIQIDMRQAIERDLEYVLHIDLNEKPVPVRSLNVKPLNTSNAVLGRLKYLEGQEKSDSKGRNILLKYQKKREDKAAIENSGSTPKGNQKSSLKDVNDTAGISSDLKSDEGTEFYTNSSSDLIKTISNALPIAESLQNINQNLGKSEKVNRILKSIRERDVEDLEKIKYNAAVTLKKEIIDHSSIVPNSIVQSLDKLNDELAFGTRIKYVLGHPTNPGKRESRVKRDKVYSKQKKGSDIDLGVAEKNYEKAEIDAFTDKQKKEIENADKILSEIKDLVEGDEAKGLSDVQLESEIEQIRQKAAGNKFIEDIKSIKQLKQNEEKKPKKVKQVAGLTNENNFNKKSEISALRSVKSIDTKASNVARNKKASTTLQKKDNTQEDVVTDRTSNSRRVTNKRSQKSYRYKAGGAREAKNSLKSIMKRKIDPARLLQENQPTHFTPVDMKKAGSADQKRLPRPVQKKEVKSLNLDPVNSHGRPGFISDKTQDKISLISNVLVELPYELVESEEQEDFDLVDQNEYEEEKNKFPIVFTKKIINRRRFLKHVLEVKSDLVFDNKIYCTLHTKDRKTKTKINSKRFILDLSLLRTQFLYPESSQLPVLKVSNPNKQGEYVVSVQNVHSVPITILLFEKKSIPGKNIIDQKYMQIVKRELSPDETFKKEMIASRGNTSQFRLTFSTRLDNLTANFGNIITADTDYEQKNNNQNNVSLFAYQKNSAGVYVVAKNMPLNVGAIKILRKEIDVDGGNNSQKNSNFSELTYVTGEKIGFLTVINSDLGVRILDKNVKDDRAYQYKVEMFSSSGVKIQNSSLDDCHYVESRNLIDANLRYVGGSSQLGNYNFVLELTQEKNDVEEIIGKFKSERFELFKDKIDNLTKTLLQEPTADVFLINTTTGVELKIGEYSNKSLVTVSVKKKYDYIILVKPKSFNPELVLSELNRLSKFVDDLEIDSNTTASRRKQAIDALKQKTDRELISFRPEKFFSRKARKGIIDNEKNKAANFNFDIKLGNYTGDNFAKKIVNRKKNKFGARPGNINVLPNNQTHVSFTVLGEIKKVDFYFISVKKEGSQFPLTTVMGAESATSISFMDFNNVDYLGRVDYYVQAIFRDGSISNPNYIGTCALLEKQYL